VHARKELDALAEVDAGTRLIHPQAVTRIVSELAAEDAIFSCAMSAHRLPGPRAI
jgi:pyruvate dehydrogenase (quinone)